MIPVAKKEKTTGGQVVSDIQKLLKVDVNSLLPGKGKKGKKGEKGQKDQKDGSGKGMVETYAKSIQDHMLRHYEMFVFTAISGNNTSALNIMDLIYYHTFGDYRMVYDEGIKFEYLSLDAGKDGANLGTKPHAKSNTISDVVGRDSIKGVNYVYGIDPTTKKNTYSVNDITWMNDELNKGSNGMRLMLPSIGTLMMTTYGYGNINEELQNLVRESLTKLREVMQDVEEDSNILEYLVNAIKSDKRWDYKREPTSTSVQQRIEGSTTLEDLLDASMDERDDSWEAAIKYFTKELIESTTARYMAEETVSLAPNKISSDQRDAIGEVLDLDVMDPEEELFTVVSFRADGSNSYKYRLKYEGTEIDIDFQQNKLLPSGDPPLRLIEKKDKKFIMIPDEQTIVFYSILIDQIFALQAYLMTVKVNKLNFGYMAPTFMVRKTSAESHRMFPNMYSPNLENQPDKKDYLKGKPNEKSSFLFQLLQHRNLYTQMILKAQRRLAQDTRSFDLFYDKDLTLKEIEWLAYALSDESKVLVKQPDKSDPLAQLIYQTPGGDSSAVQFTGEADRRTAFYTVDIPMLKEVMLEYVKVFNEYTIKAAFAVGSGDAIPKEGQIAKALWASLRKRSSSILEDNEAIPHEFFTNLFEEVRKAAQGTSLSFELYPPNWSNTNILTMLTVDPAQLNTLLTTLEYQTYLNEYIEFIYNRFGSRASVAAAITTSLESYRIKAATGHKELRENFLEMLTEHEKKKQLKATNFVFRAYSVVIAIMRGQLSVPLSFREDAIAEGYEREALQAQLKERPYGERGIAAAPAGHPLAELRQKGLEREARLRQDEKERVDEDDAKELVDKAKKQEEERIERISEVTLVGIVTVPPPPPPLLPIDVADGPVAGNTTVLISGTGFTTDPTQPMTVTFGGIDAYEFTVDTPTQITATTPTSSDGTPGPVAVEVTKSLQVAGGINRKLSSAKLDPANGQGFIYH